MSIFEYDKEKEEKKLRKAEFEYGREQERNQLLTLISQMSAGEDADKITQLNDPAILEAMMNKYGIE